MKPSRDGQLKPVAGPDGEARKDRPDPVPGRDLASLRYNRHDAGLEAWPRRSALQATATPPCIPTTAPTLSNMPSERQRRERKCIAGKFREGMSNRHRIQKHNAGMARYLRCQRASAETNRLCQQASWK